MNDLTGYLETIAGFSAGLPEKEGYLARNPADFVLRNGCAMTDILPVPKGKMRKLKECFYNASMLAIFDPRFAYCEGYATAVIPVPHAWCIAKHKGKWMVWDNTWRQPGTEYYGVAITTEYLKQSLLSNKYYGVIDAYGHGWPMLRTDPKRWVHPAMKELHEARTNLRPAKAA